MLVIAHPDDEAMFFSPFLWSLRCDLKAVLLRLGVDAEYSEVDPFQFFILCMSTGNAEGLGTTRVKELEKSISFFFPIKSTRIRCHIIQIDNPHLLDSMNVSWDNTLVSSIIHEHVKHHRVNFVVTFDANGVSGHPNHIALYNAVKSLGKRLPALKLFFLQSLACVNKYSGYLHLFYSLVFSREPLKFYVSDPRIAYAAMQKHHSQFLWYRKLFILFSSYSIVNEFGSTS